MDQTKGEEKKFLDTLNDFLARPDVTSFFVEHPNRLTAPGYEPHSSWVLWWDWSSTPLSNGTEEESRWQLLWRYYSEKQSFENEQLALIPESLRKFIDDARYLQLRRERASQASVPDAAPFPMPITSSATTGLNLHGMSPKKAHEVICAVDYTRSMLHDLAESGVNVRHVVDVGAGQVRSLAFSVSIHIRSTNFSAILFYAR